MQAPFLAKLLRVRDNSILGDDSGGLNDDDDDDDDDVTSSANSSSPFASSNKSFITNTPSLSIVSWQTRHLPL